MQAEAVSVKLRLKPSTRDEHNRFVGKHHRHSAPIRQAQLWASVVSESGEIVGVASAGRPNARVLANDCRCIEIYRVCSSGSPNACSMLYGALCRAAKALGYIRVVTYTLRTELGASLKASGFERVALVDGRDWDKNKKRLRLFANGPEPEDRVRWERQL
jgi:hypothetical protein